MSNTNKKDSQGVGDVTGSPRTRQEDYRLDQASFTDYDLDEDAGTNINPFLRRESILRMPPSVRKSPVKIVGKDGFYCPTLQRR